MSYSESRLYNSALFYLQRYASTAGQLRRVLQRKLKRAEMKGEEIPPQAAQWIEKTVEKCVALGFVNDRLYAESRVQSLRRQGRAKLYIQRSLQEKGVEAPLIAELLADDPEVEQTAASRYAQRRRLGRDPSPEGRQKDLAKLMRAGFSMSHAKKALAECLAPPEEDEY